MSNKSNFIELTANEYAYTEGSPHEIHDIDYESSGCEWDCQLLKNSFGARILFHGYEGGFYDGDFCCMSAFFTYNEKFVGQVYAPSTNASLLTVADDLDSLRLFFEAVDAEAADRVMANLLEYIRVNDIHIYKLQPTHTISQG